MVYHIPIVNKTLAKPEVFQSVSVRQKYRPFYPVFLRNNNYQIVYDKNGKALYDYGDGQGPNGAARSYAVYENPVGNLQQDKSQTTSNITNINTGLNYEIIKGLDFTYNFGAYLENIKDLRFGNTIGGTSASVGAILL